VVNCPLSKSHESSLSSYVISSIFLVVPSNNVINVPPAKQICGVTVKLLPYPVPDEFTANALT